MASVGENPALFESRKADHIRLALDDRMQAFGGSGLSSIRLHHEALPEIDFADVTIATELFSKTLPSPMFISSMTAGHPGSYSVNLTLAQVAERRGWAMGIGSQRRQLVDRSADDEWIKIRRLCPNVRLFGNIGLAQLIRADVADILRLVESVSAEAMIVHANPLQECMQPEGTPQFRGGMKALEELVVGLGRPVILKETGCGFSQATLTRLNGIGLAAVDVSGFGGTHWGRIEGGRSGTGELLKSASETFSDWGVSTVESVLSAVAIKPDYQVWASGGVRSGLDAAKLFSLGASLVGFAKPLIESVVAGGATSGEAALERRMALFEYELRTALFCTGSRNIMELRGKSGWVVGRQV